ncbi:PucR family transcriptional regulator [Gordonia soli]|uniref:Putative CdaR family transcriptional regulator n=1 Tax=Gordonia soli NBRC 108243 TaxID=1223545 RepID=M0QQ63_9ACTN|nr:helix-turn-helix domain-containing protein [Gordonia soli]GAC70534.1 putative CdaR family transcriptional regulator [Gordonia soli NBRC 108243]
MDIEWPTPTARTRELFRRGAEQVLSPPPEWIAELHSAALGGFRMNEVADDPTLAEGTKRSNLANLLHWAAANVHHPGDRVGANVTTEVLDTARDLVRRGLDESSLDAFRTAQSVAWRRWMQICFALTDDPDELRELLDLSSLSISTFIDDTVAAMSERMRAERADLTRGTHAERRATVALILENAPIPRPRAEERLGHRLTGPHTAAVVWGEGHSSPAEIEAVADRVSTAAGTDRRLTVMAGATAMWLWLPVADVGEVTGLSEHPDVRVAIGRSGVDVEGFRQSHFDALSVQRLMAQLGSPRQSARYDDTRLVTLLTDDRSAADEFVADTLGELAHGHAEIAETVRTWIAQQCNTSRTAEQLYTHRNTVIRRLTRADELLPGSVADDFVAIAAALEIRSWRPVR